MIYVQSHSLLHLLSMLVQIAVELDSMKGTKENDRNLVNKPAHTAEKKNCWIQREYEDYFAKHYPELSATLLGIFPSQVNRNEL